MQSRDQTPLKCQLIVQKADDPNDVVEHQEKYRHVQDKHLQQIQSKKQIPVKKGPAKGE